MASIASLPEKLSSLAKSRKWDSKGKGQCFLKQQIFLNI